MKKIINLSIALLVSIACFSQVKPIDPPPQNPELAVVLTLSDWNDILRIIHEAPVVGAVRDKYRNAIGSQCEYRLQQLAALYKDKDNGMDSAVAAKKRADSIAGKRPEPKVTDTTQPKPPTKTSVKKKGK